MNYNRDIRPILSENCYTCHGPDSGKRKAGLRLDRNEEPYKKLESGKVAVVPGHLEQSELIRRILVTDDDQMPPAESGKKLSKTEIDLLSRWVKQGAQWKGHWAYLTPDRPALPKVINRVWSRNAIDQFILARLEKAGLKPSQEADKRKLIRRVTFDLTGLPPTVAEMDAFLSDKSARAYEKLVDRLLASPAFGERMAQGWLDLARYADTNGYHIDNHRDMWLWREWVINAFNKNMPFDQFTVEQLAGDMLPNATVEQKIASGFNRNNMVNFEGGADPAEYATKYVVDRVQTTSTVWLGSTMGCAECHDHKYDPFTQKEFYQMYALFNNIPEIGLDGQKENPVPSLKVPSAQQVTRSKELKDSVASLESKLKKNLEEPDAKLDLAQKGWEATLSKNAQEGWSILAPEEIISSAGATFTKLADQSVLASGTNADNDTYTISLKTPLKDISGIRLEALADESLPIKGAARSPNGNFVLSSFEVEAENLSTNTSASAPEMDAPVFGTWHSLGPFKTSVAKTAFTKSFIKEAKKIDLEETHVDGLRWIKKPEWKDAATNKLSGEISATYLFRTVMVTNARPVMVSFGSDDGLQVWLNEQKIFATNANRGVKADDDKLVLNLVPGENRLLLKINNNISDSGFYFSADPKPLNKYPVLFSSAVADFSQKNYNVKAALDADPKTGWAILEEKEEPRTNRQAVFIARQPFGFSSGTGLKVRLKFESISKQHSIGRFRLALSTSESLTELGDVPEKIQTVLFKSPDKLTKAQRAELTKYYRSTFVPEIQDLEKNLASNREELTKLEAAIPSTMVMQEMEKPRDTFLLIRGNFQSKGEKVSPAVPKSLFSGSSPMPTNRLQFAQWLVSPEHPLTSRVTVNRFWQMFFGTGLVKSANDFGSQGEWPSHPELLDYLATEFIAKKWDTKAMLKMMVMSATYRQDTKVSRKHLERDPYNRLLTRGPRFRLDAEMIRDNALAVSGLLNRKIGGESVRPYQPDGLWEAVSFGGGFSSQSYAQSKGEDLYRRGLYVYWKRSLTYPSLVTFDAPNRELCTVQRPRTSTPLQALVLMNDPAFIEAARGLAQRILREGGDNISEKLNYAFRLTISRSPTKKETELLKNIYHEQLANFQKDTASAQALLKVGESTSPKDLNESELAAWTAIGNILLNLDETITKG